jgi:hypothetical protein
MCFAVELRRCEHGLLRRLYCQQFDTGAMKCRPAISTRDPSRRLADPDGSFHAQDYDAIARGGVIELTSSSLLFLLFWVHDKCQYFDIQEGGRVKSETPDMGQYVNPQDSLSKFPKPIPNHMTNLCR